ncbi:ParB/RepB/Spo0J family partition protein [Streptomyces sp. S07_1.15]|uniref:ParB/RepB/Spo0J family partition protein n=1 Tax=Streptomyces sp. S07_1.15 TaxID=2873925 RepID=UPI001D154C41|nr:ParB/RepB/Spo0J family partition protein [Streptomyces sp. S07_1.15]MCC3655850.1 ParB/RepB/Spo0J family partition protein [Streptomyces sp. S07_1.15]
MSRVADQLGTGASFGRTRGGVSARRQAVAATTGAPTTGAPDSRLRTLPLTQLVCTRFNPRRNFGSEADLLEFGLKLKKKQLQPAVAVTREAYLHLWPDEADNVGSAPYVIANGERRYRGSLAAGLPTLEVVVDDEIASSRADFLDAVLSENNDREDLDPIERALGIQTMVEELGGKAIVAEHYGKSAGWVTQQMYLLDLAPELQSLVSSGELPVRETRALAKLPKDQQAAAWQARSTERVEEKAQPKRPRRGTPADAATREPAPEEAGDGQSFTAVKDHQTPVAPAGDGSPGFTAVKPTEDLPAPEPAEVVDSALPLPDQRATPGESAHGKKVMKMPWADGEASMDIFFGKLEPQERHKAIGRYLELLGSPENFVADLRAASTADFRRQVVELLSADL